MDEWAYLTALKLRNVKPQFQDHEMAQRPKPAEPPLPAPPNWYSRTCAQDAAALWGVEGGCEPPPTGQPVAWEGGESLEAGSAVS